MDLSILQNSQFISLTSDPTSSTGNVVVQVIDADGMLHWGAINARDLYHLIGPSLTLIRATKLQKVG